MVLLCSVVSLAQWYLRIILQVTSCDCPVFGEVTKLSAAVVRGQSLCLPLLSTADSAAVRKPNLSSQRKTYLFKGRVFG